ncbi:unnamed protein product [Clonostachys solani]|uniref:Pectate lyase n=1 Tax=Clonostachys solani TaxID=160281 RepID=A0A9N9Z7K6_9HYPO|nr:unnamed protein product [Clonostachys solani]
MQYRLILAASMAIAVSASPAPMPTKAPSILKARAPAAAGSSVLSSPMTIAAGETFDGGNVMYDRGVSCTGQEEGGDSDAVFILEKGASLSNVIIGPNQIEGVHCNGGCTITNVWWDAVCEDAFSIKKQDDGETTTINGGGATGAEDKVIQHNGGGTVAINNFEVSDFGKMYRSCGNCKSMPARHVIVTGGSASNGKVLVGINSNMGDTASISGVSMTSVGDECIDYEGVTDGSEPSKIGPCSGTGSGGSNSSVTTSAAATASTKTSTKTSTKDSTKTTSAGSTKTTKSSTKTTKTSTKTKTTKKATKTSSASAKATKA